MQSTEVTTTRLLLVRHGQIDANVKQVWHGSTDSLLTETGRTQAQRVAAHLARTRPGIRNVYASPLLRARHTADAIAAAIGLTPRIDAGLAEYGIGRFEGESYADLGGRHGFFARAHADLDWAPDGGESMRAVADRTIATWRTIAAAHPGCEVVVVTHGAALATGLATLLHDDPRQWERYHTRNTSVTELILVPLALVDFDRADHLDPV